MRVVQTALKEVADNKTLGEQGDLALPLIGLAMAYNKLSRQRDDFYEINEHSLGRELKIALSGLRFRDKISVLHLYRDSVKAIHRANTQPPPQEAKQGEVHNESSMLERLQAMEIEERIRFRALASRVALFVMAPIPPFLVGAWFVLSWQKGSLADSAIADGVMSTVLEMFKLLVAG